jgi:phytoene/squalene synthetase
LLERIEHDPTAVLDRRLSLPTRQKVVVATRAIALGSA